MDEPVMHKLFEDLVVRLLNRDI